jgi:iron-sulfur cluster repair protein YtfE (RIC family)
MPQYNEAFLKVSKEHTIVKKYIWDLKSVLESDNCVQLQEAIQNIKADLLDHFNLEERIIFPAALICLPSLEMADRIIRLSREHGVFESDVPTIIQFVECHDPNQPISQELGMFIQNFIERLETHARIEMDELFPKMDQDKRCLKVIQDLLEET